MRGKWKHKSKPPTGVPAFLSWSLSNNGTLPLLGASFLLINFNLYKRSIKGTTSELVKKKEKRIKPKAKGSVFGVLIIVKLSDYMIH